MSYFYVYVLQSLKDKNFYLGYTKNLNKRIREHKNGESRSTKHRRPFKLIYFEGHTNKFDALRRERYFKNSKGKSMLKTILKEALNNQKIQNKTIQKSNNNKK